MMKDLIVEATGNTPAVRFSGSTGVLELRGESYPENSFAFFDPLIAWLRGFLEGTDLPVAFEVEVAYMNTSSIRAMVAMLDLLEEAHLAGRLVTVRWLHDPENERAIDVGEEFREDLTLPFEIAALAD